ncbi:ABC transporter substrate-binding protein [Rhodococcus baikonurensis]|uniref:ABC transporter substrate-binding protein n=1 Tax=Rhodococcus baikonurensis TaxID=172041 RepID=UPI0037A325D9
MRQFTTSIAVIALLSLSLAACGGGSTGTDAESIKIGVLLPLAGPVAQTAGLMKNVAEMTAAQINAAGGVDGKNIDIEVYDTKTDPAEAAKQAQRAITQDRVTALIGAFTTPETLAVADVAERSKVVLIAPSAATPAITADKKYVFRTAPVTGDLAEGMMQVAKALGDTNGALMYDSGGLGLGAKDPIEAAAAQEGVTLTGSVQYPLNASDVSAQVSAAAKDKPGAVFIAGSAGADHGVVAKAMVEQGLKVPFIGLSPIGTPRRHPDRRAGLHAAARRLHAAVHRPEQSELPEDARGLQRRVPAGRRSDRAVRPDRSRPRSGLPRGWARPAAKAARGWHRRSSSSPPERRPAVASGRCSSSRPTTTTPTATTTSWPTRSWTESSPKPTSTW